MSAGKSTRFLITLLIIILSVLHRLETPLIIKLLFISRFYTHTFKQTPQNTFKIPKHYLISLYLISNLSILFYFNL